MFAPDVTSAAPAAPTVAEGASFLSGVGAVALNPATWASAVALPAAAIGGGAVMGAIRAVLGPWRLAPSISLTIGGLPGMKQLSGLDALKQFVNTIAQGAKQGAHDYQVINGKLNNALLSIVGLGPTPTNGTPASVIGVDSTKYNPYHIPLNNAWVGMSYFSTATTSTVIYLAGHTGTSVGSYWWNTVVPAFASTASNSLQSIFYSAELFTDALCGLSPSSGILTIETIVQDSLNNPTSIITATTVVPVGSTASSTSSILLPSLQTFAATMYYPNYINSATTALTNLLIDANTSTTTLAQLTADFSFLNSCTQILNNIVTTDLSYQTAYLNQGAQISNASNTANLLSQIRQTQTSGTIALYQNIIDPTQYQAINILSSINDLVSPNTATVQSALATLGVSTSTNK